MVKLLSKYFFIILPMIIILVWVNSSQCASFKDSLGREINLKQEPHRIVSLAPNITEILYFLGLGDRITGVTNFSYYPPEAAKKPKVGSYVNLNVEKIIDLSPDLVIGTVDGNEQGIVELLEQAGIKTYIINPRGIRQIIDAVAAIGRVCGVDQSNMSKIADLSRRVDKVLEKTRSKKRPLTFLQINLIPIMSVNQNTFHHDLISMAGGINMTGDEPVTYPRIGIEAVIGKKPDVIIISSMERGGRYEAARQNWKQWKSIPAVQNNRLHLIDSDLIDRPSPRIIDGLEELAMIIHPEVNWEEK